MCKSEPFLWVQILNKFVFIFHLRMCEGTFCSQMQKDQKPQRLDSTNKYCLSFQSLACLIPLSHKAPLLSTNASTAVMGNMLPNHFHTRILYFIEIRSHIDHRAAVNTL